MKALILGGGKIARGFIGHLLYLSHIPFVFVDCNEQLIEQMNRLRNYHIYIMGNPAKNCQIDSISGIVLADVQQLALQWEQSDLAFTAVGGKNLESLGKTLAEAFHLRLKKGELKRPFTIITCENWQEPAAVLTESIRSNLVGRDVELFDQWIGITEAVVMRSAVEPTQEMIEYDPLCVRVQDYWELPVDVNRFKGEPVPIVGVRYMDEFSGFLERKFYTYNSANGTVAYLGYLHKHKLMYEAATNPRIIPILEGVYREVSQALIKKHGIDEQAQLEFSLSSKRKLQDHDIVDYVERNARDPIRKLGPHDRLVGSARLVIEYGGVPDSLATAIAAALYYDHPNDPVAQELRHIREQQGIDAILQTICNLSLEHPLTRLIKEKVDHLQRSGLI